MQEISQNHLWLRSLCDLYPQEALALRLSCLSFLGAQVPSGFLLADALLMLDEKLGKGLLQPKENFRKQDIAAREAKRMKRLLGALRHLWRNSS